MQSQENQPKPYFLMCERKWVFYLLIVVAGMFGAYTYVLRGNVFCNAQTGNVVLMGLALGGGKWRQALYYLIPISAYLLGAFVSEWFPNPIKRRLPIRWDTLFIVIEMLAVLGLGLIPLSAPVQIPRWPSTLSRPCSTIPSVRPRASPWPPPLPPTTSGRSASVWQRRSSTGAQATNPTEKGC